MPKPLQATLATVYGSVAEDLKARIGDAQAAQAGPPMSQDIEPATDEKRVEAWNARRPEATDEAMMAMAQQKYQEHRTAGLPEEKAKRATAEDLTHFRYGQRLKQYTYGQIGFADQVKEARRLATLAARTSTPDPSPPPPTMPSAQLTNLETMAGMPAPDAVPGQPTIMPSPFGQKLPETPMPPEPPDTLTPGGY